MAKDKPALLGDSTGQAMPLLAIPYSLFAIRVRPFVNE
jgi:hypothetical protein